MVDYHWELWGLFVSAFISATIAPGGSEALLLYLLAEYHDSVSELWAAATLGNTLGGISGWLLGWLVSRGFRDQHKINKNKRVMGLLRRWGSPVLLLSWLPVVGDLFCVMAGWLRVPLFASAVFICIGKALRYFVLIMIYEGWLRDWVS